jgi:cytochrome c2
VRRASILYGLLILGNLAYVPGTLERWLEDLKRLIPGQTMGYQVAQREDRADLIAYLSGESEQ